MINPISIHDETARIVLAPKRDSPQIEAIPPMVYRISADDKGNIFLNKIAERFTLPAKIYGKMHELYCKKAWDAYMERAGTTGLLMTGQQGGGKSLTAETLCNKALDEGIPVYLIDQAIPGQGIELIARITGPSVFYLDEFSKCYEKDQQAKMLATFSNSGLQKVLFIVADNETTELNKFMLDRPGRFLFHIKFKGVTEDLARELCRESNITAEITDLIAAYVTEEVVSMDVLRCVIGAGRTATSVDDYLQSLNILNVPRFTFKDLSVMVHAHNHDFQFDKVVKSITKVAPSKVEIKSFAVDGTGETDTHYLDASSEMDVYLNGCRIQIVATDTVKIPAAIGSTVPHTLRIPPKREKIKNRPWESDDSGEFEG